MKIKIRAYNETTDEFVIETLNMIFDDLDAKYIQLADHDNAEESIDMIDREIEASKELEDFLTAIIKDYYR